MKAVYLRWLDSATSSRWQHSPNEYTGLSEIQAIGYLIHEDSRHVQIAQSNFSELEKYDGILAIPKSVILERHTIKLPRRQ
jgi:hypothetical protein